MNANKRLQKRFENQPKDPQPVSEESLDLYDDTLRRLLDYYKVPPVPPALDAKIAKAISDLSDLQLKAGEARIELRQRVVLSLVRVFAFSVFATGLIVILLGFGLITLPPEVIHVLLASTIAQVVVLYRRVIPDIF
jgi:hypothetical protein